MIFKVNDKIDNRFVVTGMCSDKGGMGGVLFVQDLQQQLSEDLVLKFCREEDEEYLKRFKREVRLLESFNNNSKVVRTLYSNVDYDPPYFIMEYYPDGDLTNIIDDIISAPEKQEDIFNKMIDCISELHSQNIYHRDIKPQNFLLNNGHIVVSDFGLGMEPGSSSRFTKSSMFWGTQGYLPPEFEEGGFKHADETGDIFMLGKSFYVLLTKQNPTYLMDNVIHPALHHVINRACALDKNKRYQSLPEMKQALKFAFDVILHRDGYLGEVSELISTIEDRLVNENKYSPEQVIKFIEKLPLIEIDEQISICQAISRRFFSILTQEKLTPHIYDFLKVYSAFVDSSNYSWAFAEDIASNMSILFNSINVSDTDKAFALEIAIEAAALMNRFAAMDTCISLIRSVTEEGLSVRVVNSLRNKDYGFIKDIEISQCKSAHIINYIRSLK
ncbi:TPA: serine/threonine protein kinase [Providencia rettgeri]|uniref:serine/threonine-protein kinase n=1 Tax=Providencia huaxiensis TaxID=2027290 RepID=UPI00280D3FD7|nr:serine/threonine protein kinase [Providencia rettgeri]HEC8326562.1 serine/threonine protein kinase [Providencia rettgeri]